MGYYEKLTGPALEAYRVTKSLVKQKAMKELKLSDSEVVTRMLRPEDLGLSTPVWTFNVASGSAWNTLVSKTVDDNRFIGIYGILIAESGESVVTQLKVTRAGEDVRYWQIQDANFLESPIVYFDDPITVEQNTTLTIKGYATGTDSAWRGVLLGVVGEKKGMLVK